MSAGKPWPCRLCGAQLGLTWRGRLYVCPGVVVVLDDDAVGWLACPKCGARRAWRPAPRYTDRDRDAPSSRLVAGM